MEPEITVTDQQFLLSHLENDHVKTAVLQAWKRLPEADQAFLRLRNIVITDDKIPGNKNGFGFAITMPFEADENRFRHIWLNPDLDVDTLVSVAGHEFAHHVLRHCDMVHNHPGAWQLKQFLEQQANWLACDVWGFANGRIACKGG